MKIKISDMDAESFSWEDEIGDVVVYPDHPDGVSYTIAKINEDGEYNITYTLISEEDGMVIQAPFEDCLHVASRLAHHKWQLDTYERLLPLLDEAREFVEKYGA